MGKKSSKQETERSLPDWMQGPTSRTLSLIEGGNGTGAFDIPRETLLSDFVPFAPQQLSALSGMEGLARGGSPLYGASEEALMGLLNPGDFTQSPGFQSVINRALERVVPGIRSPFASPASGGGSALENRLLGEGVAQATGNIYQDQYNRDRAMQLNAIGAIPQVRGQRFEDMARLFGVGEAYRGADRERLVSDYGQQEEERQRLTEMVALMQPFMNLSSGFGTTEQVSTPGSSPLGTALGLGLTGAGIFQSLYGGRGASPPGPDLNAQAARGV